MTSIVSSSGSGVLRSMRYPIRCTTRKRAFMHNTITYIEEEGIAKIKLNRPSKKNAFDLSMYLEVASAISKASCSSEIKIILLSSSGDYYSSGNDLSNFSQLRHPKKIAAKAKNVCLEFVDAFISSQKPIVCAINGPAIGIATTKLGLCDRIFSSYTATFRTPFAELGQAPEGCSSFTFPKIMGAEMAHQVLWKGKTLNVYEAYNHGLVHSIHPPGEVNLAALSYCRELVRESEISKVHPTRSIIKDGMIEKLKQVNREECDVCEKAWISRACFLALIKYLESRGQYLPSLLLRIANATGDFWGQPR